MFSLIKLLGKVIQNVDNGPNIICTIIPYINVSTIFYDINFDRSEAKG